MKTLLRLFASLHAVIAALFVCASLVLIAIAASFGWHALAKGLDVSVAQEIIEAIGLIAVAVVALQIARPSSRKKSFVKRTSARQPGCGAICRDFWWSS